MPLELTSPAMNENICCADGIIKKRLAGHAAE